VSDWIVTSQRHIDLTYTRQRRSANPEIRLDRKEYQANYNLKYRETHSGSVECPCGQIFKETSKYAHWKSKRHLTYVVNVDKNISVESINVDTPPGHLCEQRPADLDTK
jgi:hypothetical protein